MTCSYTATRSTMQGLHSMTSAEKAELAERTAALIEAGMVPDLADAVMEQTSVSFVSPRGASKGEGA